MATMMAVIANDTGTPQNSSNVTISVDPPNHPNDNPKWNPPSFQADNSRTLKFYFTGLDSSLEGQSVAVKVTNGNSGDSETSPARKVVGGAVTLVFGPDNDKVLRAASADEDRLSIIPFMHLGTGPDDPTALYTACLMPSPSPTGVKTDISDLTSPMHYWTVPRPAHSGPKRHHHRPAAQEVIEVFEVLK